MSAWITDAICKRHDPELFTSDNPSKRAAAKAICATCPVIGACRQYALDRPKLQGIWGGLGDTERSAIRASQPNQAARWMDGSTGPRHAGPRAAGVL